MAVNKNMKYTFENLYLQIFSFPTDIIYRLRKGQKLSSSAMLKLYQTCKYFYYKQRVAFFDEIIYSEKGYWRSFSSDFALKFKDSVLLIANSLTITFTFPPYHEFVKLCPNITSIELRYLDLKYNEFEILTSTLTIKKFIFIYSSITYSDNSPVFIDSVMERLLNVEYFTYDNRRDSYPLLALEKLNAIKFANKFKLFRICIYDIDETFDPTILCKFFKNKFCERSTLEIYTEFTDKTKLKVLLRGIKDIYRNLENSSLRCGGTICTFKL